MKCPPECFRLEAHHLGALVRREAEQMCKERQLPRGSDCLECSGKPSCRRLRLVVDSESREVSEQLEVRPVREAGAVGDASAFEPPESSLPFGLGPNGSGEPRLPNTWFARQCDDGAGTVWQPVECLADHRQLALSSDELGRHTFARS